MASKENAIGTVDAHQLASAITNGTASGGRLDSSVLIVDSRSFLEYNDGHVAGAVNVCCSKLVKRRLQQDKVCVRDFLLHNCHLERRAVEESGDVIVYDQASISAAGVSADSFLHVLLHKLVHVFRRVFLLSGGFLEFQARYGHLCQDKSRLMRASTLNMTSLSQPCLPITNAGPTRILPFLYLGSQQDAHNHELLNDYNITYEVNVSTNCPKPDFIGDSHFLRLPVNDSHGEKLLPYFNRATQFIDKVRETNGSVLVHCLAGISRSPTVAIAYVMRHLKMTFDDAFRYVKSKRASISPNFNFLGQLLEYERQLRAEEVLDSSVGDISCLPPASASLRCPLTANNNSSPSLVGGRPVGLSRSVSLSLSLKSPALETVPPSPDGPSGVVNPFSFCATDETDTAATGSTLTVRGSLASDLSPTSALARLTFDAAAAMEPAIEQELNEWSSAFIYSRGKHVTRKESCRSSRKLLSSSSSSSTESHYFSSQEKTESTKTTSTSTTTSTSSRSSMVLTVSQSKRVTTTSTSAATVGGRPARWKEPPDASPSSLCSEISVRIEESAGSDTDEGCDVEIRRRGPHSAGRRPHSDVTSFRPHQPVTQHRSTPTPTPVQHTPLAQSRSVPRRPSYAPSEASSTFSDEMLLPPTPSSPLPANHCLLSPQTWSMYARSDSVTTSGLGSEISDAADDAFSLCSGSARGGGAGLDHPAGPSCETESLAPDDGVFVAAEPVRLQPLPPVRPARPRPSSLLGIIPAKDVEWRPATGSSAHECVTWPFATAVPAERKQRPTSLTVSSVRVNPAQLDEPTSHLADDQLPDSATVFRLWREREAAMEQQSDRSDSGPARRRSSKELVAPAATGEVSSKRKSSEMPDEATSPPPVVEKRRSTRDGLDVLDRSFSSDDGALYRVKSCPDMVDQMAEDDVVLLPGSTVQLELELLNAKGAHQHVQLRLRSSASRRNSQTQRFSCGALDSSDMSIANGADDRKGSASCASSSQNSSTSLNCSSFSIIEVS